MRARVEQALHAAWQKKGLLSLALWPLSQLYAGIAARRRAQFLRHPERVHHDSLPVVVVGNLYVGGTGKTPVVIALLEFLQERGWHPGVVSRGYGARPGDKPRVGNGVLDPALFGDEPTLIAAETGAPVSVHPDRVAAIRRLRRQYPAVDIVVSDDGLQHLALGRDLEIIVQDARGIGNGYVLPAGPLREPASRISTADFIVNNLLPGEPPAAVASGMAHTIDMSMEPAWVEHLLSGEKTSWKEWLEAHGGEPCLAAAAIGRPERFFAMLARYGLEHFQPRALPDHFDYERTPFSRTDPSRILITPKDAVKCRKFNDPRLYCVNPQARFSDPGWLGLVHELLCAISERKHAAARTEELNSEL